MRRMLLGIAPSETSFERRGFRGGESGMRARLEQIGATFVGGYHRALEAADIDELVAGLATVEGELAGFAYEGAAMGLAVLDLLSPWSENRVRRLLRGRGAAHRYMVHVGVGWAWARLPVNIERGRGRLDPLLGWLAVDGYGFHEGFFHFRRYFDGSRTPRLTGYAARAFDFGFGRCLWFIEGGDVERVAASVGRFPESRRGDLWSGVGLAATYAGAVEAAALNALAVSAGQYQPQLAQGAAFAAKARLHAGNPTEYTGRATGVLCGCGAADAAQWTDDALVGLEAGGVEPAFEVWRRRVQMRYMELETKGRA